MTDAYQPRAASVPDKPALDGLEAVWSVRWEADQVYRFDRSRPRESVYSIDTPPPTVSGSLHVGHVFSYTHADIIARYQRMNGKAVFYPIGWDDNGLPTERRVQNVYGVRCDPSVPYDPSFVPPDKPGGDRGRRCRSPGGTSSSCASGSPRSTSAPSRTCGGALAFPWTGRCSTRRSATTAAGVAAGVPAQPRRGARRTGRRRPRSGTSRSRRRSPRRSLRTASTPARSTGSPSTGRRAPSGSRPRGPSCCPPASRWSRTRTTRGTRGCSAAPRVRRCSASRCPSTRTRSPSRTRALASRWCAPSAT